MAMFWVQNKEQEQDYLAFPPLSNAQWSISPNFGEFRQFTGFLCLPSLCTRQQWKVHDHVKHDFGLSLGFRVGTGAGNDGSGREPQEADNSKRRTRLKRAYRAEDKDLFLVSGSSLLRI